MAKPTWVTLDKSSGTGGGSVKVTASNNSGSSTRSGSLNVKTASGLTKSVSLSQAKATVYTAEIAPGSLKVVSETTSVISGTSFSVRLCFASGPGDYEDYVDVCSFSPYITSSGTEQQITGLSKTFTKPYYCMGLQIGGVNVSNAQTVRCDNMNVRRNGTLFVTNWSTGSKPFIQNNLSDKTINMMLFHYLEAAV